MRTVTEIVKARSGSEGWFKDEWVRDPTERYSTRQHAYGQRDKPGNKDIENAVSLKKQLEEEGYKCRFSMCDEFVTISIV